MIMNINNFYFIFLSFKQLLKKPNLGFINETFKKNKKRRKK